MNTIRAYPGDLLLVTKSEQATEAWFVSQWQYWLLLFSALDGSVHNEIGRLAIRDIHEFHLHLSRIFQHAHVQVVHQGNARISVTIMTKERRNDDVAAH